MPAHPEDAYLFELDYDENDRIKANVERNWFGFTERAQKAQAAKWERLFKKFAPMKTITAAHLATPTHQPRRLVYGWGYKYSWLRDYAVYNRLAIDCRPHLSAEIGKDELIYGELTEEEKEDKQLVRFMTYSSHTVVRKDLELRAGLENIGLIQTRPFTDMYDGIVALYSNYDIQERRRAIEAAFGIDDSIENLNEAMKECGNDDVELMWWYDMHEMGVGLDYPC